jgi:hypothetical protein
MERSFNDELADLILSFSYSLGGKRLYGNIGMRKTRSACMVVNLDTFVPIVSGRNWSQVYCSLAVSQRLDLARVVSQRLDTEQYYKHGDYMTSKNAVSVNRRYIAMCNKTNFDGFYFKSFFLPHSYENNSEEAARYFLFTDFISCLECVFPEENLKNIRELL